MPGPWPGLYDNIEEIDTEINSVEGEIPKGLTGTLYRNGPAKRDFSDSFFDGDGMVRALSFPASGPPRLKCRYVETPKYLKEKNARRKKVRTAGTELKGGMLGNAFRLPANEVNTSVIVFNGTLLTMEEGGPPWEMEQGSLATRGVHNFDGQLSNKVAFSAHPHIDPDTGELFNFGMSMGAKMAFQTYKIDSRNRLTNLNRIELPRGTFSHDFALSKNWMIFFLAPLKGNLTRFLFGRESFFGTLKYDARFPTEVVLVPRNGGRNIRLETAAFMSGHVVSAFETSDEIIIDMCTGPDESFLRDCADYRRSAFNSFNDSRIDRFRINPSTGSIHRESICDVAAEFPRVNHAFECRESRWAYSGCNPPEKKEGMYQAVMKLDRHSGEAEIYDFGTGRIAWEPVFIPRKPGSSNPQDEDDGWLVNFVHNDDRKKTDAAIFDAKTVGKGPVAMLQLPCNLGSTFHGWWEPA